MNGLRTLTIAAERGLTLSLIDAAATNQKHWIADVRAWLNPDTHMTKGMMTKISSSIFALAASNGPITSEGIALTLRSDDPPELSELAALIQDSTAQAPHLRFFALEVLKCWRARQTSIASTDAARRINDGGDVDREIEQLSALRSKLLPQECADGVYDVVDEMVKESTGEIEPDPGYRFSCNTLTHGLERVPRGSLLVVAAPTGQGKSIWVSQEAFAAAKRGGLSLLFSVEMSVRQVVERLAKSESGLPAIRSPEYVKALNRIRSMLKDGHHLRIYSGPRSMDSIVSTVNAQAERGKIAFVGVDYVQILTPDPRVSGSNREQQVSQMTKRMKTLAIEHDCIVATCSQLNKAGKVRESEAIEFDCDVLLQLSELESQGYDSKIGVSIEKNRHGSKRKLVLAWDKSIYRFRDLESDDS